MKVLIACEFSGIVRDAFAARGHDAWSCDLLPTERPGNHIQGDVIEILGNGWDLMVAHPPCTDLAVSGAAWFSQKIADGRQQASIEFFLKFVHAPIPKSAVENPVSVMSSKFRQPDQIIHPYYFGDAFSKTTCLWLKSLPPLEHREEDELFGTKTHVGKGEFVIYNGKPRSKWFHTIPVGPEREKIRSRTFQGIANAMASQWG